MCIRDSILTQHSSIHAVAKEVGYSRTSVSRYLSGKYDSCAASLEEKLAEFLEAHTGEAVEVPARGGAQRGGEPPRFYESRDAKAVLGVCPVSYTHLDVYKRQSERRGRIT